MNEFRKNANEKEFKIFGSDLIDRRIFPEQKYPPELDAIIVLGKNLGIGVKGEDIRKDNFHLSTDARMNAIAVGMIWEPGIKIIFSTGRTTTGVDAREREVKSEAAAMRDYMLRKFPDIPIEDTILEEISIDTSTNAEEVAKMLELSKFKHIGLMTVDYHLGNSLTLFERFGVPIEESFASNEIIRERSSHHRHFEKKWRRSSRVLLERFVKEGLIRKVLLHTVDPRGELLRKVTSRTRK